MLKQLKITFTALGNNRFLVKTEEFFPGYKEPWMEHKQKYKGLTIVHNYPDETKEEE